MPSAFSVFRKNQRWLLALFGVLVMIGWSVGGIVLDMGRGRGNTDPVVAETSLYGGIHESDLKRMLMARGLANSFLQRAFMQAYGFPQQVSFGPDSEQGVVETMLLARKAEQMGMRVTDGEITRFLTDDVTAHRVSGAQFDEILKSLGGGRSGVSRHSLYEAIRVELLAQNAASVLSAPQRPTPAQRWMVYEQLHNRANITAVPVAVDDFLDKVPEPSDTQVAAFFEKYKNNEPIPGSPEPGFKIPPKVALQYLKADYEQFDDPQAVTYKEIVEQYNKFKDTRYLYSGDFGALDDLEAGKDKTEKADGEKSESKPESKKDESAPAGEKSQAEKNGGGDGAEAAGADDKKDTADKADKKPAPKDISIKDDLVLPRDVHPPKYDPLWKVEAEIRGELSRRKAVTRMDEVLAKLRDRMVKYGGDWSRWDIKHERDKTLSPPKPLDFEQMAAENHLTTATTPLLSPMELRKTEGIGSAMVTSTNAPLIAFAFGQSQLYQPTIASDLDGNHYLLWKTEQQPARVPEITDVRDEVVKAYKMIEGRKLALERAKALASTARTEKISVADLAKRDELQAIKPEPFSWLTFGAVPDLGSRNPPRLSEVQGLVDAGPAFMQAVFNETAGGITTAFNNPQTICYVVEANEFEPGIDVMHSSFLADDLRTYGSALTPQMQRQMAIWGNAIQGEAGLKWTRAPDQRRTPADTDESDAGE